MVPRRLLRLAALLLVIALAACQQPADLRGKVGVAFAPAGAGAPGPVTLPLILAARRPLVEVAFARPDGSVRRALAWVNMGAPAPVLSKALYRELELDRGRDLAFRFGPLSVDVRSEAVTDGPGELDGQDLFALLFAPRTVEAVLPAGVLRAFQIVLDPEARTLTLARPGTLEPEGVPVPIRVDPGTGLVIVEGQVAAGRVPLVVDAGAPYTWLRRHTVEDWLRAHPAWSRADGAVGASNLAMAGLGLEREGRVIRLPELGLGPLAVRDVGALGTGPLLLGQAGDALLGEVFWDLWQRGLSEPVAGWLGGNVLAQFRLTIDYSARMSYWRRVRASDAHDLDGLGLTLVRRSGGYAVAAVASRNGAALVPGVEPGDRLVRVDGLSLDGLPTEAVLAALHGPPGGRRVLDLVREGAPLTIVAQSSPF